MRQKCVVRVLCVFLGIKSSASIWVQAQKTHLLPHFDSLFLPFVCFYDFHVKNVKKPFFDLRLECVAPKHWLKYTTMHSSSFLC